MYVKKEKQNKGILTRTIPALRVSEETYQFVMAKKQAERRARITEVARILLEDGVAANRKEQAA